MLCAVYYPIWQRKLDNFVPFEVRFYRRMPRTQWREHVRNEEVLKQIRATKKLLITIRQTAGFFRIKNRRLGEFNIHRTR